MAFKIVNSSTLLLPAWKATLSALDLAVRLMPRDVATRWNSTFDMLDFALEYRLGVDAMTSERKHDLRKFELTAEEWEIARQLHDVLKVRVTV